MVMEQYLPGTTIGNDYNQNEIPEKCKPNKAIVEKDEGNSSLSIECNICLDLVKDPVVTFCGHLYCWPCIYKWIRFQSESSPGKKTPHHCPVCKAEITQETLIPLYVNGLSTEPSKEKSLDIPQRPQSPRQDVYQRTVSTPTVIGRGAHEAQPFMNGGGGGEGIIGNHPEMGMFGEFVYARIFGGNTQTTVYAYPISYDLVSTNPRVRRHLVEVDRSLSRLTFFLMCCMFLCLILF